MTTAHMGCKLGMCGIAGATTTTLMTMPEGYTLPAAALLGVGGAGGFALANQVSPIQLPQTVAAFHSLVGAAAMVASIASYMAHPTVGADMHNVAALLGDFIGGVTLTGSIVAFAKLDARMSSAALNLPGRIFVFAESASGRDFGEFFWDLFIIVQSSFVEEPRRF